MHDENGDMAEARRKAAESQRLYDLEQAKVYAARIAAETTPRTFPGTWAFTEVREASGELTGFKVVYNDKLAGLVMKAGGRYAVLGSADDFDTGPRAADILSAFLLTGKAGV